MPKSGDVRLFVATILPDENRPVLGAEPSLCQAVCDGIRHQGYLIRDSTTDSTVTSTDLETLLESGLSRASQHYHSHSTGLESAVDDDQDIMAVLESATELLDLCRSSQRSYFEHVELRKVDAE